MKRFLYITTILILAIGCKNNSTNKANTVDESKDIKVFVDPVITVNETNPVDTTKVDSDNQSETFTYNVYKSDSVTIDVKNDNFDFVVLLSIGDFKKEFDLNKLNIPTKTPDQVQWINNEYAYMMTWWSQAQSRHIFIPTKRTNELIYLDKDIEATDSVNNNVVYIDTVLASRDKLIFKAENLLTRKSKALEISINEKNGIYPFYDKIILTKSKLTIATATETKSIDIKEINIGL